MTPFENGQEAYFSYMQGKGASFEEANPHTKDSPAYREWLNGWQSMQEIYG